MATDDRRSVTGDWRPGTGDLSFSLIRLFADSLRRFIAPSLHRSIAPSLHRSIAPSLHRSIAPSLHRLIPCLLLALLLTSCAPSPHWVSFLPDGTGYRRVELDQAPTLSPAPNVLPADLDADGEPEQVYWEGTGVRVERAGETVWQSEPEWRVVDVAAGDIWNDLRQEVVMAMWKDDKQGEPRSHPFIMGHRHGRYDLLWGGSAVAEPIKELELGDVDGDGRNELVVLEGRYGDPETIPARTVSVWRWNGWGFTQIWRSEPGRFADLHLVTGEQGDTIVVQAK